MESEVTARRFPLTPLILVALVAGGVVGWFVPGRFTTPLGEIGMLVITAIKTAATPLIFLAILDGVLANGIRGRDGMRMLGVCAINASPSALPELGDAPRPSHGSVSYGLR